MIESNKSENKLALIEKDLILLKQSEIAKDHEVYGNLYDAIQYYDKVKIKEIQKENSLFDSKARAVLLHNKNLLIDNMKKEWIGVKCYETTDEEVRCQLCSHKNKFIFFIKNKLNGNELHVGSECIKHFQGIEDIKKLNKDKNQIEKQRSKDRRTIEFDEKLPDYTEFIRKAETAFENINIVLPYSTYEELKKSLYAMNIARTNYINNGGSIDELKVHCLNLKKRHLFLWNEAKIYYQNNCRKKLICHKDMGDWLKKDYLDIWEKISRNNGLLTVETLPYINKGKFIQKYLPDFQRHIRDQDLSILKIDDSNILFQLTNLNYRSGLSFEIDLSWFMKNIGCYCLTDKKYKFGKEQLSSVKDIPLNSKNLTEVINRLNYNLKDIGYEIVISERINQLYYKRLREIVTKNNFSSKPKKIKKQAYAKVSNYVLLSDFSSFIFETDEFIKRKYKGKFGILECRDNIWMDEESKNISEQIASEAASMQKQKEFVPYI